VTGTDSGHGESVPEIESFAQIVAHHSLRKANDNQLVPLVDNGKLAPTAESGEEGGLLHSFGEAGDDDSVALLLLLPVGLNNVCTD